MKTYTFRYNAFGSIPYFMALIPPICIGIAIWGKTMWLIAYWLVVLAIAFIASRRKYLIIDSKGISIHRLFGLDQHVTWSNCGCYKLINDKEKNTGIGIANRKYLEADPPNNYSTEAYIMFINTHYILNKNDFEQALHDSFDYYVYKKPASQYEEDNRKSFYWRVICGILISILAACYLFFCYTYTNLMPDNYDFAMRYTLLNGETYGDTTSSYSIGLFEVIGFIVYILLFLIPNCWAKGYYKTICISSTVTLLFMGFTAMLLIPERMNIYQNCSETTIHPTEIINTVVSINKAGREAHMSCILNYENVNYLIQCNYVEGAEVDDSVLVYIQKGAKNIPIVRDIVIPKAHWSLLDYSQKTVQ